jgi:hypothetical protein
VIQIVVVPREGANAYRLLRAKVLHEAATWYWSNKAKTRLRHVQSSGHIDVANAGGVVIARVSPKERRDLFYLAEKFMGRLVAWFEQDLAAINMQLLVDAPPTRKAKTKTKTKVKTKAKRKAKR